MAQNEKNNQSIDTDIEQIQSLELTGKDIKRGILIVFGMLKNLSRDMKDTKRYRSNLQR